MVFGFGANHAGNPDKESVLKLHGEASCSLRQLSSTQGYGLGFRV